VLELCEAPHIGFSYLKYLQNLPIRASRRGIQVEALEISLSGQIDNIFVFLGLEPEGHSGFRTITGTLYVQADAEAEILQELWRHTVAVSPVTNTPARPVTMDIALRQIL